MTRTISQQTLPRTFSQQALLEGLRKGVGRATDLITLATDYHGGPITTEYLLTADIAREFIEHGYDTRIECLNRFLVNGLTADRTAATRKSLGSKRTDIALLDYGTPIPIAIIEVKIGVKTLSKITGDIEKIADTISCIKPQYASRVVGAVVFQVHVKPGKKRKRLTSKAEFKAAIETVERSLKTALADYAKGKSNFTFNMKALQSPNEGIVERDSEYDGEAISWGQEGHATHCHAVIIRSALPAPPPPKSFAELKARR
jgi:hypothetical protein